MLLHQNASIYDLKKKNKQPWNLCKEIQSKLEKKRCPHLEDAQFVGTKRCRRRIWSVFHRCANKYDFVVSIERRIAFYRIRIRTSSPLSDIWNQSHLSVKIGKIIWKQRETYCKWLRSRAILPNNFPHSLQTHGFWVGLNVFLGAKGAVGGEWFRLGRCSVSMCRFLCNFNWTSDLNLVLQTSQLNSRSFTWTDWCKRNVDNWAKVFLHVMQVCGCNFLWDTRICRSRLVWVE